MSVQALQIVNFFFRFWDFFTFFSVFLLAFRKKHGEYLVCMYSKIHPKAQPRQLTHTDLQKVKTLRDEHPEIPNHMKEKMSYVHICQLFLKLAEDKVGDAENVLDKCCEELDQKRLQDPKEYQDEEARKTEILVYSEHHKQSYLKRFFFDFCFNIFRTFLLVLRF